jgi:hypothetical protein
MGNCPVQNHYEINQSIHREKERKNDAGSETHEGEKESNARLEPRNVSLACQYSPLRTRRSTDITICARKGVLSLNSTRSNIITRPTLRRAGVSERNELSHEPLQYFPHSTPTFSCARRAREFLQGAPSLPRSLTGALMTTALDFLLKLRLSCRCTSAGGGMRARPRR